MPPTLPPRPLRAPRRRGAAFAARAAALAALAPAAAAQVAVELEGGHLLALAVGPHAWSAGQLATARSEGAVSFADTWGVPVAAADELDLARYFARSGADPVWDVHFHGLWLEADDAAPDFFVFEVGGNDPVTVRPRLADGALGAPRTFTAWQPVGLAAVAGPNAGQPVALLALDAGELLGPTGAPLAPGTLLAGLRIESAEVDGAAFCHLPAPDFAPYRHRPRILASPEALPAGAPATVALAAVAPALGGPWSFEWDVPGASFLPGFDATQAFVRVELDGQTPATATLRARPVSDPSAVTKATLELGLALPGGAVLRGAPVLWHPLELRFQAAPLDGAGVLPNPFLDRRLDVVFTRPDGSELRVPGFFDGNGKGGVLGGAWKARLAPDQAGAWSFQATLRAGPGAAVAADPAGFPAQPLAGAAGAFEVAPADPAAPGFLGLGRVVYAGEHHRRHAGGPRFVKGGVDSPENLLAFRHFRGAADTDAVAPFLHAYAPHVGDWDPDADPELPLADDPGDRGLVGALRYLGEQGVNAVYFLPMNLGGDGRDTAPFGHSATAYARTHYAPARLLQWEAVFRHATARGILLHVVLAETEPANEQWLDGGGFGPERKLYLRELVARFAHHLGVQWNLSEESDFGAAQHKAVAAWLRELDPYDHPITVHTKTDGLSMYNALYGDAAFEASSVQYSPNLAGAHAELVRQQSAAAGRPWSAGLDENNPAGTGLTDTNAVDLRKRVLWDVYLSGGEVEWYCGAHPLPLGGDQNLEDFRTREAMWTAMRHARAFLAPLPIWHMAPADALLAGESGAFGGGEVFAEPGHVYAVYLPEATGAPTLDLTGHAGPFELAWYDPRTGSFVGPSVPLAGGAPRALGPPPTAPAEDWAALVRRPSLWSEVPSISMQAGGAGTLHLDAGPEHAGELFAVLGSLSGTAPGLVLGDGVVLPLVPDAYTLMTLQNPGATALQGSIGQLDAEGRAAVAFALAPGAGAPLAGQVVAHAFAAGAPQPQFASVPVVWPLLP